MDEDQLRAILNQELASFFGKLSDHVDRKIDGLRDELKADTNRLQNTMDGIAGRLDTDDQERTAMNAQLDRHEEWIDRAASKLDVSYDNVA